MNSDLEKKLIFVFSNEIWELLFTNEMRIFGYEFWEKSLEFFHAYFDKRFSRCKGVFRFINIKNEAPFILSVYFKVFEQLSELSKFLCSNYVPVLHPSP